MNTVKLRFHECYPPFIKVYPNEHRDRTGETYYKAFADQDSLPKVGFIVREDFYTAWHEYQIGEIIFAVKKEELPFENSTSTLDRIHMCSFKTFTQLLNSGESIIEVQGVYIDGSIQDHNLKTGEAEIITFLPSIPNRFSFTQLVNTYNWNDFNLERYTLKSFTTGTLIALPQYSGYVPQYAWERFDDAIYFYLIVHKQETYRSIDYDRDGNEIEEEPSYESFAMVYGSEEDLFNAMISTERMKPEFIEQIKNVILEKKILINTHIDRLRQLKKLAQKGIGLKMKFEFAIFNILRIEDKHHKTAFYHLRGHDCDFRLAANGLEKQEMLENLGTIEVESEYYLNDIYLSILIQV